MLFFLISNFAVSAAFNVSIWVLKKTYNGVASISNMSVAAAVAAYSYSTTGTHNETIAKEDPELADDEANSIELLDCVIVSNYE